MNLDRVVDDMFCGSSDELVYGTARVQPTVFQDNILRMGDSLSSVRAGNVKIDHVMCQKKLVLNSEKTGFIMVGGDILKNRNRMLLL